MVNGSLEGGGGGGGGRGQGLVLNLLTFISDKGVHMHFKTLPTVLLFSASLFIIAD